MMAPAKLAAAAAAFAWEAVNGVPPSSAKQVPWIGFATVIMVYDPSIYMNYWAICRLIGYQQTMVVDRLLISTIDWLSTNNIRHIASKLETHHFL